MIDLSPFLTPYPRPNLAAPTAGAGAISDLADFQANQSKTAAQQALEQEKLKNEQAQTAINKTHVEGTNAYYADQVKLHQEQLKEKEAADLQKQQDSLGAAYRKAKTPEQRQLILQAYKRTGAKVEEQASSIAAPGAEASSQGPDIASSMAQITGEPITPDAPFASGQGPNDVFKARPTNPKLAGVLATEAQGATPPAPADEPFPWEMLGMGAPKPAPAPPPKPQGTGRTIVTDPKTGAVILDYDEPAEGKMRSDSIRTAFAGLQTGSPEEKAAADKAINVASGYAQQTSDIEGAKTLALDLYKASLGEYKKKLVPGQGGAGGGVDEKHAFKVEEKVSSILKDEDTRNKYSAMKKDSELLQDARSLLATGSGPAQTLAAVDLMRKFNGRAGNQAEFSALKGGAWYKVQSFLNSMTDERAPMPEGLVRDLAQAVDAAEKTLAEKQKDIASETSSVIEQSNIPFRKGEKERALARANARSGGKGAAPSGETPEQKRKRLLESL